jgi:hypothetical protein
MVRIVTKSVARRNLCLLKDALNTIIAVHAADANEGLIRQDRADLLLRMFLKLIEYPPWVFICGVNGLGFKAIIEVARVTSEKARRSPNVERQPPHDETI